MKLSEVFEQLGYGELSQVSIGGQPQGTVNANNAPQIVSHLNLAFSALFKRFKLKERQFTIPLQSDADMYELRVEDIIKIEKVIVDSGVELPLNVQGDVYSCFTPSLKILRVSKLIMEQSMDLPDDLKTENLVVVYRANHPRLVPTTGFSELQDTEIELPASHLQAALYFVASRVNNPIGMTNEFNAGNNWYSKYELECQRLTTENIEVDQATINDRATRNGWA